MDVSTYGKNLNVDFDRLQKSTEHSKRIVGVWKGYRQDFAVVEDGNQYVGVAVNCTNWKEGQVMYEFLPVNDTVFEVLNYSLVKNRTPYRTKASLYINGRIMEFHDNTRFVRKSDSEIYDEALLSSYMAEYPNGRNTYPVMLYLSDSTYYLRISSFNNDIGNDFVINHWDEITSRPNLIIDIRNNPGGQDNYYSELVKLVYTKPYESKGVEWYASEGNIKVFEDAIKNGNLKDGTEEITQCLVDAMKENIGRFIMHPMYDQNDRLIERDTIYPMPRNIGIIINEGNASAAEQFLLTARNSDKVILFGNSNTGGVLDYSNVTSRPLPSNKYELWCPMTRSRRLPENPIDNIGISPDITIPFPATEQLYDRLDVWVYFVREYLEALDQEKSQQKQQPAGQ